MQGDGSGAEGCLSEARVKRMAALRIIFFSCALRALSLCCHNGQKELASCQKQNSQANDGSQAHTPSHRNASQTVSTSCTHPFKQDKQLANRLWPCPPELGKKAYWTTFCVLATQAHGPSGTMSQADLTNPEQIKRMPASPINSKWSGNLHIPTFRSGSFPPVRETNAPRLPKGLEDQDYITQTLQGWRLLNCAWDTRSTLRHVQARAHIGLREGI